MFKKYQHLERLGTTEVEGITSGLVYVFPKLDGTNASVWLNEDGTIGSGSRNRDLTKGDDNAGFNNHVQNDERYKELFEGFPEIRLYGEWLVPHSLKTYRDDVWKKFYVFDVTSVDDNGDEVYYTPDRYIDILEAYNIDYIPYMCKVKNGSDEKFRSLLEKNTYLLKENSGHGEGLVLKNYDFVNKYGRVTWAKIISNSFKDEHVRVMGGSVYGGLSLEEKIVEDFVTQHLVDKVYAKIKNENQGSFLSKDIPRLLNTVFYDLIQEEMWEIIKKHKMPKIDFKYLNRLTTSKVKESLPNVF